MLSESEDPSSNRDDTFFSKPFVRRCRIKLTVLAEKKLLNEKKGKNQLTRKR